MSPAPESDTLAQMAPGPHPQPLTRLTILRRAGQHLANLLRSECGPRARFYFLIIATLLISVNGFNVLISYASRDFMTAIEQQQMQAFLLQAAIMIGLFGLSTVAGAFIRYSQERLDRLWRVWLTRRTVDKYLGSRTYQYIEVTRSLHHPDQRIQEDVRALTGQALSFILMVFNSLLSIAAFAGVLWSISPPLFGVSVVYAMAGSVLTLWVGRRLSDLNSRQLDREADFRSDLLHVGANAEAIALMRQEPHLSARIKDKLNEVALNTRQIISVNLRLQFFTSGYSYLIQIIPALVVAPYFIEGKAEFGVIAQSALAFTILVNAFSLIVSQFPVLSNFAAVITRLEALIEVTKEAKAHFNQSFEVVEDRQRIAWQQVSLLSRLQDPPLTRDLNVSIPLGTRVLITARNKVALIRLFNATAGVENHSVGTLIRPPLDELFFLPERPYLAPGTLRQALLTPERQADIHEDEILSLLGRLGIVGVIETLGGLDQDHTDWNSHLSISEQKLINIARLLLARPRFSLMLRLRSTLDEERLTLVMQLLRESSIGFVNFGKLEFVECYDAVLELLDDGTWHYRTLTEV
ncbi:MAG: ABC transporter ATP-binding protein/permease [Hahellaceae bacterium]|nr:ABC transporter ATP-binding protein/permease [Hahellaceae bacterium]